LGDIEVAASFAGVASGRERAFDPLGLVLRGGIARILEE
jgi:hypothetical protein